MDRSKLEVKLKVEEECGKRLKKWLESVAMRSATLGELINYTPQYISNVINGKKRLTEEMAERIANIPAEYEVKYGQRTVKIKIPIKKRVNADWLLCRSNDMTIYEAITKRLDLASEDSKAAYDFLKAVVSAAGYTLRMNKPTQPNSAAFNQISYTLEDIDGNKTNCTFEQVSALKNEILHYAQYLVEHSILEGGHDNGQHPTPI